jgi:hypothetical protein
VPKISDFTNRSSAVWPWWISELDTSGSRDRLMLLRRVVLPGFSARSRSLPAEDAIERVAVDVALLLLRNFDRALCRRVLILLMPASSQRRLTSSRAKGQRRRGVDEKLSHVEMLAMARVGAIGDCNGFPILYPGGIAMQKRYKGNPARLQRKSVWGKIIYINTKRKSAGVVLFGARHACHSCKLWAQRVVALMRSFRFSKCIDTTSTIQVFHCVLPPPSMLHA